MRSQRVHDYPTLYARIIRPANPGHFRKYWNPSEGFTASLIYVPVLMNTLPLDFFKFGPPAAPDSTFRIDLIKKNIFNHLKSFKNDLKIILNHF